MPPRTKGGLKQLTSLGLLIHDIFDLDIEIQLNTHPRVEASYGGLDGVFRFEFNPILRRRLASDSRDCVDSGGTLGYL